MILQEKNEGKISPRVETKINHSNYFRNGSCLSSDCNDLVCEPFLNGCQDMKKTRHNGSAAVESDHPTTSPRRNRNKFWKAKTPTGLIYWFLFQKRHPQIPD